jgi:hypothetical protein
MSRRERREDEQEGEEDGGRQTTEAKFESCLTNLQVTLQRQR